MPDPATERTAARARLLALEGATVCFFVLTLLGLLCGADAHVAALRGLVAGALVAFAGPFAVRVVLDAAGAAADRAEPMAPSAPAADRPRPRGR